MCLIYHCKNKPSFVRCCYRVRGYRGVHVPLDQVTWTPEHHVSMRGAVATSDKLSPNSGRGGGRAYTITFLIGQYADEREVADMAARIDGRYIIEPGPPRCAVFFSKHGINSVDFTARAESFGWQPYHR
jgi:hypothetical protein